MWAVRLTRMVKSNRIRIVISFNEATGKNRIYLILNSISVEVFGTY